MEASLAPGTRSNLRTALRHFESFVDSQPQREVFQHPRWAGDLAATLHNEMTFMLFAVYLVRDGLRLAGTALNYCSLARSHIAAVSGFPFSTGSPRWKKLIRAIRKLHHRERRECRPLRAAHLRGAFYGSLSSTGAAASNEWALVATGIFLLARPTELSRLRRCHLSWESTPVPHAIIRILPLKKGPEQSAVPMLIAQGGGGGADAYAALRRLLRADPTPAGLAASTPLFREGNGSAFSTARITQLVQRVAAAGEGYDTRLFTGRSLRIGGATELHAMGADQLTIMLLGRWSSDVARIYTRVSQNQVLALSAGISAAPEDPALEQVFPDYVQTASR